jgi:predicted nucleic acid-binding protein
MILIDTSVWIDHLHQTEPDLVELLERNDVATHPMVLGELALGSIADRTQFLGLISSLPTAAEATHAEVMDFVDARRLYGRGLSLIDAHLLASAILGDTSLLWTRDQRLARAASDLRVAWMP